VGGRSAGDDEQDPPATPGDQSAAQAAGVPELDYARDGELDLVTDVGLPDAEHHGNVVWNGEQQHRSSSASIFALQNSR
jgi:hypothetical protein